MLRQAGLEGPPSLPFFPPPGLAAAARAALQPPRGREGGFFPPQLLHAAGRGCLLRVGNQISCTAARGAVRLAPRRRAGVEVGNPLRHAAGGAGPRHLPLAEPLSLAFPARELEQLHPGVGAVPLTSPQPPPSPWGLQYPPERGLRGSLPVRRAHRISFPAASEWRHRPDWSSVRRIPHLNRGGGGGDWDPELPPQIMSVGCFLADSTPNLRLPTNKSLRHHVSAWFLCNGGSLNPQRVGLAPVDLGKGLVSACSEWEPSCSVPRKKQGGCDRCQQRSREGSDLVRAGSWRRNKICLLPPGPSQRSRAAPAGQRLCFKQSFFFF